MKEQGAYHVTGPRADDSKRMESPMIALSYALSCAGAATVQRREETYYVREVKTGDTRYYVETDHSGSALVGTVVR